jgi:hypothetical protein
MQEEQVAVGLEEKLNSTDYISPMYWGMGNVLKQTDSDPAKGTRSFSYQSGMNSEEDVTFSECGLTFRPSYPSQE